MKSTLRTLALASASGVVIALSAAGIASAITEANFIYSSPKTGRLVLLPAAFTPRISGHTYANTGSVLETGMPGSAGACWNAPVNLPHGAKMTALMTWYALENGDGGSVHLLRLTLSNGSITPIVARTLDTTGNERASVNSVIANAELQTVNNGLYGYYIQVCLADNADGIPFPTFRGARLTYTYTSAGD